MRTKKNNQNSKNQFKNRTEFCCQTKKETQKMDSFSEQKTQLI
jgi:hypothetical protein